MTEHERRLKRAARFGIDTSTVVGPSLDSGFDNMDLNATGIKKVERLEQNIARIKHRQQKFCEEPMAEAVTRLENLENRITKLHNVSKPDEIKSDAVIIEDKLYLYGTDFMSTKEIKEHFMRYTDLVVQWINDSSCTLKFLSPEQAAEGYH
jgi:hypothetical protein